MGTTMDALIDEFLDNLEDERLEDTERTDELMQDFALNE